MRRAGASECTGRTFDLLVIGGGMTGAATARDAALRGLDVLLLEAEDYGSGTSSRSSKLLHGGLRYLRQGAVRLVREACRERELLGHLAPHQARAQPFLYLLYPEDPEPLWQLRAGLTLYDAFSGNPRTRRHDILSGDEVLAAEPHVRAEGLRGAGRYQDFLTDDARLTLDTVKSAADAGALVANHAAVEELLRDGRGRVVGARVSDRLAGDDVEVGARMVVNSAGVWVDAVRRLADPGATPMLRPTKGSHIVVSRADFPISHAMFFRHPRDGRTVWPIPARDADLVYLGTTDTDHPGPVRDLAADEADVTYLLEAANHLLPDARLDASHLRGSWAGLRPLVASDPDAAASDVSREHVITEEVEGLVTIAGGKLSTGREMAEQLVDVVARRLRERHGRGAPGPCRTHRLPLAGGDVAGWERARRRMAGSGLPVSARERILARYGDESERLLDLVVDDPRLVEEVSPGLTRAEVAFACRREQARDLADVLVRRTSQFFWSPDGGAASAHAVAAAVAEELGWTDAQRDRQVAAYAEWRRGNGFRTG